MQMLLTWSKEQHQISTFTPTILFNKEHRIKFQLLILVVQILKNTNSIIDKNSISPFWHKQNNNCVVSVCRKY